MSGLPMIACSDRRPMFPVVHWITRNGRSVLVVLIGCSFAGVIGLIMFNRVHGLSRLRKGQSPAMPTARNTQPTAVSRIATSRRRRDRIQLCSAATDVAVVLGASR